MRAKPSLTLISAAAMLAAVISVPAAAEPLPPAQMAARTASGQFEFRSRNQYWRFTPDGKVQAEYTASRMVLGGMGEQFGMRASGVWRRDGNTLCIDWRQRAPVPSGCYVVKTGDRGLIRLVGPAIVDGTLDAYEAAPPTGVAERPQPQPRPFGR